VIIQGSALFIKIVGNTVEFNINYGGKYLDLSEMKGREGCQIYK
jgi:hypothetical protein